MMEVENPSLHVKTEWQILLRGKWSSLDDRSQVLLEDALVACQEAVPYTWKRKDQKSGGVTLTPYVFDLTILVQRNIHTGYCHKIRRVLHVPEEQEKKKRKIQDASDADGAKGHDISIIQEWQIDLDGQWCTMCSRIQDVIREAVESGRSNTIYEWPYEGRDRFIYELDLAKYYQKTLWSGKIRNIRCVSRAEPAASERLVLL